MKFVCVPCDTPMKLLEAAPPDRGSVALTYSCPDCGYEFAMLTNPFETQLVSSLGVSIGSPGGEGAEVSKCPFTGMLESMTGGAEADDAGFRWTDEARARLQVIPEFVRPMAKSGIEKYARDKGYACVDEKVLDEARQLFGM